jgi:hypothetical protein
VDRRQRADLIPAELLEFDPKDWANGTDDQRWQLWERWKAARRQWVAHHPESNALGDKLERLRFELEVLHPGVTRGRKSEVP